MFCKFFAICFVVVALLVVLNLFGDEDLTGIAATTSTKIKTHSPDLWVHLSCFILITLGLWFIVFRFQNLFFDTMRSYRKKGENKAGVATFSAKLRHLPLHVTEEKLVSYFDTFYPDQIVQVKIAWDLHKVSSLREKKVQASQRKEKAEKKGASRFFRPPGTFFSPLYFWVPKRDEIEFWTEEITRLEKEIQEELEKPRVSQGVAFVTFKNASDAAKFSHKGQGKFTAPRPSNRAESATDPLLAKDDDNNSVVEEDFSTDDDITAADDDAAARAKQILRIRTLTKFAGSVPVLGKQFDPEKFKDLTWDVKPASPPEEIMWDNLQVGRKSQGIRKVVTFILTVLLALVWAIPISFLASVDEMSHVYVIGGLFKWIKTVALLKRIVEGISAPILSVVSEFAIRAVLTSLSLQEKPHSTSGIELSVLQKYYTFMFCNTLVFQTILQGGISALAEWREGSDSIKKAFLNVNYAYVGAFFINYLLVKSLLGAPVALLRITALLGWIKRIKTATTDLEKEQANQQKPFRFSVYFPKMAVYFTLGYMFVVIAPFVLPAAFLVIGMRHIADKNNMLVTLAKDTNADGRMAAATTDLIMTGAVFSQLIVAGFFALRHLECSYVAALIPPATIAVSFWIRIRYKREKIAYKNESYLNAVSSNTSYTEHLEGKDWYLHPALKDEKEFMKQRNREGGREEEGLGEDDLV